MDAWLETSSAARRPLLAEDDLGVEPEGVDLGHPHDVAAAEQADEAAHVQQVVGGVPVPAAVHGDVEHGDAAGAQRALHLGGEAVRVQRVVEDVGELEVEGGVGEGLRVEVAAGDERRRRGRAPTQSARDALERRPSSRSPAKRRANASTFRCQSRVAHTRRSRGSSVLFSWWRR